LKIIRLHKIIFTFLISILRYKFGLKKGNERLYFCGAYLYKPTYRYPKITLNDMFMTLRIYKRLFFSTLNKKKSFIHYNQFNGYAAFDGNINGAELRFNYLKTFDKQSPDLIISKDDLVYYTDFYTTLISIVFLVFTFFPVFIISFFSKNKFHSPLIIKECLECFYLQELLLIHKIKKVNYFCIYERDANLCAYILMNSGFFVNKIPSEVPLVFWNQIIIANQLSFCFAYQQEEFEEFKKTMFVDKTELWAPEQILNAPQRFLSKREFKTQYDIGFFSSGNWLRAEMGDIDLGHNDKENEELILRGLITYSENNNLRLKLFLHPIEKKIQNRVACEKYYLEFSEIKNVSIADYSTPSIEGFDEINIGVSLYSTLMFERIYLGFKTIIAPFGYDEFPIKQSPLKNICVTDLDQLFKSLDSNLKLSTKDFFQENHISKYSTFIN
jgi:hypothetical protein